MNVSLPDNAWFPTLYLLQYSHLQQYYRVLPLLLWGHPCAEVSVLPHSPGFSVLLRKIPGSCCWFLGIRHPEWCKGLFLPHDSVFTSKNPTYGQYRTIPTAIQQLSSSNRMRTTYQDSFWQTVALHAAPFIAAPVHSSCTALLPEAWLCTVLRICHPHSSRLPEHCWLLASKRHVI